MKAVLTLVFVIVTGVTALANTGKISKEFNPQIKGYDQVAVVKMDIVLDRGIIIDSNYNEVEIANTKNVARLYKFKNSRVKKALAFTTKRNKAKMA